MHSAFSIAMFDYQRVNLVELATKITKVFGNLGHSLISPLVIHEQSWNPGEELPNFNASPIFCHENPPSPKVFGPGTLRSGVPRQSCRHHRVYRRS